MKRLQSRSTQDATARHHIREDFANPGGGERLVFLTTVCDTVETRVEPMRVPRSWTAV